MKPQAVKFVLMAQDMDRAVAFYRDTLGFVEAFCSPYWSELRFGDAIVGLHGGGDGSHQKTGLSIQYEDVNTAFADALADGATALQAPVRREGEPIVLSSILDPEGNEIMLTQYIGHE
jgi:predicted enzyme related to lactoylglutathione lyase